MSRQKQRDGETKEVDAPLWNQLYEIKYNLFTKDVSKGLVQIIAPDIGHGSHLSFFSNAWAEAVCVSEQLLNESE